MDKEIYNTLLDLIEIFRIASIEGEEVFCFDLIKDIIDGKITRKDIEDDRRALAQHQLKYAYLWMENIGATVKYEEEFMEILN